LSDIVVVAGLDLGQAADFAALAITEVLESPGRRAAFHCRHLQRFDLGTPYLEIAAQVRAMLAQPDLRGRCVVVADATGVGAPVVDLLFAAGAPCVAITIHGGDTVSGGGRHWRVPKRDLVSVLQVLLQTGRLKFAADLPEAPTLLGEMLELRVTISETDHDSYAAWREGARDDLVLAVALAAWYCEAAPVIWEQIVFCPAQIGPR
jgi:hypothetical protein